MLEAEVAAVALEEEVKLAVDAETKCDALTRWKGDGLEQHLLGLVEVGERDVVHRCGQIGVGVGRKDDDALGEDLNGQVERCLAFGQYIEDGLVEALLVVGARGDLVEGSVVEQSGRCDAEAWRRGVVARRGRGAGTVNKRKTIRRKPDGHIVLCHCEDYSQLPALLLATVASPTIMPGYLSSSSRSTILLESSCSLRSPR